MDLIILILLVAITIAFFRKFSNVVYIICIVDMFLRIIHAIADLLSVPEFTTLVNKYFNGSIHGIINVYTTGIVNTVLVWIYVFIYIVFLYYVICTFFRKKK